MYKIGQRADRLLAAVRVNSEPKTPGRVNQTRASFAAPPVYRPLGPAQPQRNAVQPKSAFQPGIQPPPRALWRLRPIVPLAFHSAEQNKTGIVQSGIVQRMLSSGTGSGGTPPPLPTGTATPLTTVPVPVLPTVPVPLVTSLPTGSTVPTVTPVATVATTLPRTVALWNQRAAMHFGTRTFTVDEFVTFVQSYGSIGTRAGALGVLRDLRNAGVLFPPIVEAVRPGLVLSFDSSQAQQAPAPVSASVMTNREAFGMTNPSHTHRNMTGFWAAHAHTPPPPGRDEHEHYMSPSRHFRLGDNSGNPLVDSSGAPVMRQGHSGLVMGHLPSASTYVNTTGHMHSPGTNRQHNYSPSAYGQVEDPTASAASGSREPRYRSPSPTRGSWEGYWNRDNPRFHPDYAIRWPSHIRRTCAGCGNTSDHAGTAACSRCGATYT